MSFESVPCGSPESHTVIEEPAPSLYSGEETDDRFVKTLKRPQEVPESTRLADTAKIEDELIMNEEQIARVTGRINPAPPLEPPVLTRVIPRKIFAKKEMKAILETIQRGETRCELGFMKDGGLI